MRKNFKCTRVSLYEGSHTAECNQNFCIHGGVPWEPFDFLYQACNLEHPFSTTAADDNATRSVFFLLTNGTAAVERRRDKWFTKWEARRDQLEEDHKKLAARARPEFRSFILQKRPILVREIMVEAGLPNEAVEAYWKSFTVGVPTFFDLPDCGLFPKRMHEPELSLDDLKGIAPFAHASLLRDMERYKTEDRLANLETDQQLYEKTLEEKEKGLVNGPCSVSEICSMFGNEWAYAPRFAVAQKGDIRPIDNFSKCGQNLTARTGESIDPAGVDDIAALVKTWILAINKGRRTGWITLSTSAGEILQGRMHPQFAEGSGLRSLVGKLTDLKSAYKQMFGEEACQRWGILAVKNPGAKTIELFLQTALGFGSHSAVNGFNMAARSMQIILCRDLICTNIHYFDDYTSIEPDVGASAADQCMKCFFALTGWTVKTGPDVIEEHRPVFHPLGVTVDLSRTLEGEVDIRNNPGRTDKIVKDMSTQLKEDTVHSKAIASFLGRLHFVSSQVSGRAGAGLLREMRQLTNGEEWVESAILREFPDRWQTLFSTAPCKTLKFSLDGGAGVTILKTDAAAEGVDFRDVGLGAVIVGPSQSYKEYLAVKVEEQDVDKWRLHEQKQVICQAELAGLLCAMQTWRSKLSGADVIAFIDNDAARHGLIHGVARHDVSYSLIRAIRELVVELGCRCWWERVPSRSNLADLPSRGETGQLLEHGFTRADSVQLRLDEYDYHLSTIG